MPRSWMSRVILTGVLKEGAERVSPIAKSTVQLVKERMGLY